MRICGQYFSPELIARIQETINNESMISRRELSRRVCEWINWRALNGKLQDMSCRKALVKLDRREKIKLPKLNRTYAFQKQSKKKVEEATKVAEVSCSLSELGKVEVVAVSSRYSKASLVWNELMERFHYLGKGPLCGGQIRYLVKSSVYGWIGALSFSGATWRLKARDKQIGWNEHARRSNLEKIVCNSRFLILPTVKVTNLASHVLSQSVKRLEKDWKKRYGYSPVLLETFVDPKYFAGTCYKAANWSFIGQTAARSNSHQNGKVSEGKKDIYLYPISADWKLQLCKEPKIALGTTAISVNSEDWAEVEFGRVNLYDDRLKRRLFLLANDFFNQPGVLVPQVCNGSEAKTKAAYRFFNNAQINMNTLLKAHIEASIERIKEKQVVLAVQDTTTLNYTAHPATDDLGPINTKKDNGVGLVMHDTMAFTVEGNPLGLLDVQCWARDPKEAGKAELRCSLPIEDKESMKWLKSYRAVSEAQKLCPNTMLVSVGDREADLYDLFYEAEQNPEGPKLLVRAERTRNRKVGEDHLWDRLIKEQVSGYQELYIPGKSSRKSRTARMEVRFAEVTLNPPQRGKKFPPVKVWAVYSKEIDYSSDVSAPLEWMLLTTVKVTCFEDAVERLEWYACRWGIEVYHRTVKSGCRIEDRRLGNADRLESCLAIDLVVAWRIYWLTKQGRDTPDIPCDVFLSEDEWRALCAYVKKKAPPEKAPCLRDAVRMIASLGGFLGRKGDGEPGTTTMWRGIQRLADITIAYSLASSIPCQRAGP